MSGCIFAVPTLTPAEPVEYLRARFDPLHGKVPPHVTLVFPFDLPVPTPAVAGQMDQALRGVRPFSISFEACTIDGTYAYLPVRQGREVLRQLYDRLHTGALARSRHAEHFATPYRPHMTIGRVHSDAEAVAVKQAAAGIERDLHGRIERIVLETILPDNRSQVEHVITLPS